MTGELIVFVDVDALELDRLAVHKKPVADNLQAAETDIGLGVFSFDTEKQGVEPRSLGGPSSHILDG